MQCIRDLKGGSGELW